MLSTAVMGLFLTFFAKEAMEHTIPTRADIWAAYDRIKNAVHRTPVMTSEAINRIAGCEIFFKCEHLQRVGAFKFRGALNAVLSLDPDEMYKGVATHSSGNHAAALALAARMVGIPAYIVMPKNSPAVKQNAVRGYGGVIRFCEPTLQAREETLAQVVEETGATFIPPYDHFQVICGQGTAALELLQEVPLIDCIVAPVGGGGLLSGTSLAVSFCESSGCVVGAEPAGADDAYQSFMSGRLMPSINPKTIADGLLTSLSPLTFEIIRSNVSNIVTVSEDGIVEAMRLLFERMKQVVEPSGAVPLAAILEHRDLFIDKRVGVILSGGNVDLSRLPFLR